MVDILEGEMAQAGVPCTYLVRMQGCRSLTPPGQSHNHIDNKRQTQDGAMVNRQEMDGGYALLWKLFDIIIINLQIQY